MLIDNIFLYSSVLPLVDSAILGNDFCKFNRITLDLVKDKATIQSTEYKHTVNITHEASHDTHLMSITKPAT